MAKGTKKTATNANKTRGRQSDFSGEQLVYLDGLAKDFHNRKDRGAFYNEAAQGLIDKFGYSRDGKVFVQADTLNSEERVEYYQALRSKMGQWFRHRNLAKSSDRTYVAEIVNSIKSAASQQPRKRSAVTVYIEQNKEKITSEFAVHWSALQKDTSQKQRLPKYNEFVQTCWKNEPQSYREEMEKAAQEEHEKANREWKEKIESFNGAPEDFERAWRMAESVLPSFADGFADWLGAHVIIVAVSPNSSNGEIIMQSVQSDCSKGHIKSLLPQFDEKGWKKLQEMVITYGKAFFSPEECKRRIVKTEEEDAPGDADLDLEDPTAVTDDRTCEDSIDNGKNKRENADDESEQDSGVVKHAVSTDIEVQQVGENKLPEGVMDGVQIPDDKSNAETTPETPSSLPTQYPSAPSVTIKNPPHPGPSPSLALEIGASTPQSTESTGNGSILCPTATTTNNAPGQLGFVFPEETTGSLEFRSSFNPYLCNFDQTTNNWGAFQAQSSMNLTNGFWFGEGEANSSDLTLSQDTRVFSDGSFLGALYNSEPLDPSLVPSNTYAVPSVPVNNLLEPMLGILSQTVGTPFIQLEGDRISQTGPLEPHAAPSDSPASLSVSPSTTVKDPGDSEVSHSGGSPTAQTPFTKPVPQEQPRALLDPFSTNTAFQDVDTNINSKSRGRKRKGDEPIARPAKKTSSSMGVENIDIHEGSSTGKGSQVGEGKANSGEVKERAGKPTLSGRVPLMPTHLADAGYQGEKKGVRARKVTVTKKPGSKGYTAKPASKGPAKKRVR